MVVCGVLYCASWTGFPSALVTIARLSKVELKRAREDGFKTECAEMPDSASALKSISARNGLNQIPHAFCSPWNQCYLVGKLNRNQSSRIWSQPWHGTSLLPSLKDLADALR